MCIQLFFFNGTAATEIYTCGHTLSLHDALPISGGGAARVLAPGAACRGAGVRPPAQRAAAALQRAGAGGHARTDAAAARGQRGAGRAPVRACRRGVLSSPPARGKESRAAPPSSPSPACGRGRREAPGEGAAWMGRAQVETPVPNANPYSPLRL